MPSIVQRDSSTTHNTRVMKLPLMVLKQAGSARQVDSFTTNGVMELPTKNTRKRRKKPYLEMMKLLEGGGMMSEAYTNITRNLWTMKKTAQQESPVKLSQLSQHHELTLTRQ